MWDSILSGCAELLHQLALLVGDWGLAILIVTIIIRLALFPLQRKQFRSTFLMKEMQPKIQRIQELYAGDQMKISEETRKLYQEAGFNPLAGCLPMLVQMPVFIILFQTLRWKLVDYEGVSFYNILPDLTITLPDSGYNIVYIIFVLAFIGFSVAPMIYQFFGNDQQQKQSMNIMMLGMMGIMFIWMAWISPAGVILYWSVSSAWGFVQQMVTNKTLKQEHKEYEEKVHRQVVEVSVERKEKKKRPRKKK